MKLNAHGKQAYQQTDIRLKIIHHFGEQQVMSVRYIRAFAIHLSFHAEAYDVNVVSLLSLFLL